MNIKLFFILFLILISPSLLCQSYKIIESNPEFIRIEVNFENAYRFTDTLIQNKKYSFIMESNIFNKKPGDPWLPEFLLKFGIPEQSSPKILIENQISVEKNNVSILPIPDEDPSIGELKISNYNKDIYDRNVYYPSGPIEDVSTYKFRFLKIFSVIISPFQYNPVQKKLLINNKLTLRLNYNVKTLDGVKVPDSFTEDFLRREVINYETAKEWIRKPQTKLLKTLDSIWYNSNKDYYKIYLKEKGIYRITYNDLTAANIPFQSVPVEKFQLFSTGKEIPLYIKDNNSNGLFDQDDYFEFVGYAPPGSPYSYFNLYNNENIYWFSYEADTSGSRYQPQDGFPQTWTKTFDTTPFTIHYEKDSIYEKLGHAPNGNRDYWFWGKTGGTNGSLNFGFSPVFPRPENISPDSASMKIRAAMHGMTTVGCLTPDHKAKIFLSGQLLGEQIWDGANEIIFQSDVDLTQFGIYDENSFQVFCYGDIAPDPCNPENPITDEIRVNWFEIEYWRSHRADSNNFYFLSPPGESGNIRFNVYNWNKDDMKIFIPQRNEIITNPQFTHDPWLSTLFVVNLTPAEQLEFFCAAEDYFHSPDSIRRNINNDDLRNTANGADYIIITHEKLTTIAARLAALRENNFPDTSIVNPRIKVVQVQQIYNEFSGGLLDPYAIKDFIKYAFYNWQPPAPTYLVLIGDMSSDYRKLLPDSRENFIPSIPFHAITYGEAASDNGFAAVEGNDIVPDLAVGRISCETVEEGNILIDKIENYPADNSKEWKQNVLLFASGQNDIDEAYFNFNDASLFIDDEYVRKHGFTSTNVFRYPTKERHFPFEGDGTDMRKAINEGGILANYYGHGGGFQWDLVFNNDDIYLLENGGKLPFITSVTCYTAHFEDLDVFGEQFNKAAGKGSIAFWGGSALTFWPAGRNMNEDAYRRILEEKNYIIGKVAAETKAAAGLGNIIESQIALLTLLGDPVLKLAFPEKPDFRITSADISVDPLPIVSKTGSQIKIFLNNLGIYFPEKNDSVLVNISVSSSDTSFQLKQVRIPVFPERDSISADWIPDKGGLYTITLEINNDFLIDEDDFSDNKASASFPVFDLSEPSIIKPLNGYLSENNTINFLMIDNGDFVSSQFKYFIEIDTALTFTNPIIFSGDITPQEGKVVWNSPPLPEGKYFWRSIAFTESDSSSWSSPRFFTITASGSPLNYFASGEQLNFFRKTNINYSDALKALYLNTSLQPPRPGNDKFLDSIAIDLPVDIVSATALTTDGAYLYYGHISYNGGPTKIYKIGTGFKGTAQGEDYGTIPNLTVNLWHTMFYYSDNEGGHLYAATGDAYSLLKIDPANGDTSRISVPDGMLADTKGIVSNGAFYLNTDGNYVYNLSYINTEGEFRYTVRIFDPENNWQKVGNDITPTGTSYPSLTGFFVADNYLYPYENFDEGYIRRINLTTGIYEEEWFSYLPFQGFYAWTYDPQNNLVYASVASSRFTPKIFRFKGSYTDSQGSVETQTIGPASRWNSIMYQIEDNNSSGNVDAFLLGYNKMSRNWDTLAADLPSEMDLTSIEAAGYPFIKINFNFSDTSVSGSNPLLLKTVSSDFSSVPEITIAKNNLIISPDTLQQGFDYNVSLKISNIGFVDADSVIVNFYAGNSDSAFYTSTVNLLKDSLVTITRNQVNTAFLNPATLYQLRAIAESRFTEFYTFNNVAEKSFYVARDSINPLFKITFDGNEIADGDLVSAHPEVLITLSDNSPLPLDTTLFTLTYAFNDNPVPLSFTNPDIEYSYTPYPNSAATIKWTPDLEEGEHRLEVFAKDASGNYFDTTSYTTTFFVSNTPELKNIYNFPNPFKNDTYFTFELSSVLPEEIYIKVYTVAGRLIKDFLIPLSDLKPGFNRIYWDGKDQDGDEIANGLYFYRIVAKISGIVKTSTEKLVKVR
jgi:hypothetical protein